MTKQAKAELSLDMSVKDVIALWPETAEVLAAKGLDLCCGGVHPLRMAAQAHGQDPRALLAALRRAVEAGR